MKKIDVEKYAVSGKTKKDFCIEIIEKNHPEFKEMENEEIKNKASLWATQSTCTGIALEYLGYLEDEEMRMYLSSRGGILNVEEIIDQNGKVDYEIISFREVLDKLPE